MATRSNQLAASSPANNNDRDLSLCRAENITFDNIHVKLCTWNPGNYDTNIELTSFPGNRMGRGVIYTFTYHGWFDKHS